MKLSTSIIFICIFLFSLKTEAQDYLPVAKKYDGTSIGIGSGPDFGGIGIGVLHYGRIKTVGIFGGVGYTPSGIGINAGLKARLLSPNINPTLNPFLMGMYGYTTSISVSNDSQYNKMFYGSTIGIGADVKFRKNGRGFWTVAWLFPLNLLKSNEYIQYLTAYRHISFSPPSALRFSFGYRYLLN